MLMSPDVDRFRGVLLGGAVGDALGAPLVGMSRTEIRLMHDGRVRDFLPGRYGAGAFSGDTQLTVALAEALVAGGGFDLDEVSCAFGEWMRLDDEGVREARGFDHDSMRACRRLYRGVPARVGAVDSDGHGAAARAAPLGLFLRSEGEIADAAVLQAMLTHADPRALAGAVAVAVGVAHALSPTPFDPFAFLRATALRVEDAEPGLAAKISDLEEYVEEPLHEGLEYTGTGASATEAVPAALLVFAQTPHDAEEALVTAVNAGGDAAGIGAMVGALAGASNGAASLPARWLARLEDRGRIERLAEALYRMVRGINGRRI